VATVRRFNPTVLREYDIRGTVGTTINKDDAYAIGRRFGSVVARDGGRQVCIGYDGRLSSPELEAAVVEGVRDAHRLDLPQCCM
jgi:phosphomannomutase